MTFAVSSGRPPLDRIAVIAYHCSPLLEPGSGDAGGMTVYVRALADALARHGLATDIFTRATADLGRIVEVSPGVRVVSIEAGPREQIRKDKLPRYVDDFSANVRAFALSQRLRYDVIHSHYWQSGIAATRLAAVWDVPWVHSQHTLGLVKNRFLLPGDLPEPTERLEGEAEVISDADVLVASTDEEWAELSCSYGASHDRIKTLRPGVDQRLFSPGDGAAARAELGLERDDAVMLYVGRIQPLKGLELALHACREVARHLDRRIVFLVVGGASGQSGVKELRRLEELVSTLGLRDVVRFVGARPHAELPVFYRAGDVLVVCSHYESFGLAALEAQACGTPVVGTPVGGLAHVVRNGESGFLDDTREPRLFSLLLERVLGDGDLRRSFGQAARRSAAFFTWEKTAASFVELYECLVREEYPQVCTC